MSEDFINEKTFFCTQLYIQKYLENDHINTISAFKLNAQIHSITIIYIFGDLLQGGLFKGMKFLKNVAIYDNSEEDFNILDDICSGCENLKNFAYKASEKKHGISANRAFKGCKELVSINFSACSYINSSEEMCSGCSNLEFLSTTYPLKINLGKKTFYKCPKLSLEVGHKYKKPNLLISTPYIYGLGDELSTKNFNYNSTFDGCKEIKRLKLTIINDYNIDKKGGFVDFNNFTRDSGIQKIEIHCDSDEFFFKVI